MKIRITILLLSVVTVLTSFSQSFILGDSASLYVGASSSFFAGGNTSLNGTITNDGTIISYSDLDFVNNQEVGNLKFTGLADQNLRGDSLLAQDVTVDKTGNLILLSNHLIVQGALLMENGVIQAAEEDDLIVTGSSQGTAAGYVEGKLVGITTGQALTFPMGINGSPNYITLLNTDPGVIIRVELRVPDPDSLFLDEDMIGIADEVEWLVSVISEDSTDAQLTIDFSGLDLSNFPSENFIRSLGGYEPAIVMYFEDDSLYHALNTSSVIDNDRDGQVVSSDFITINSEVKRFGIALVPIIVEPIFFVPNSFAPNGLFEENRIFRPYFSGEEVSQISMTVFDNFNKKLYSIDESGTNLDISQMGWEGNLPSGQKASNGLYFYTITLVAGSVTYQKAGSILLVK